MKFNKPSSFIVVILVVFSFTAYAQDFTSYYYDYKLLNSAFAGMKDKHIINTVYSGVASGSWPQHLLYASYETSLPSIKSGIGALALYDEFGPRTTKHGGIFFNKQLSFNDRSGLRVGTQLFYRRSEIDYNFYPEQPGDPLKDPDEVTNSFNFDLGLLYYSSIVNVGLSMNNVLNQDELATGQVTNYNLIVTREFEISKDFKMIPSVVYFTDFEDDRIDINTVYEIKKWILLGTGFTISEGDFDISFNAGVNIKEWVQIITHLYTTSNDLLNDASDPRIEAMVRVNIPHREAKE